ncbi:hypothetical protein FGB62_5g547 [Gracilaria domingensis]|nr:hypothetical protein FGB62_5g547 [Gracilaria domingensis]
MSRALLCVSFVLLFVVTLAVPAFPSSRHVSVEQALARRRRAAHRAHHVAFVIRAAQIAADERAEETAVENGAGGAEKRREVGKSGAALVDTGKETPPTAAQQDVPVQSEPKQKQTGQKDDTQSEPKRSAPQQDEAQPNEAQPNEAQPNEAQQSEPQQSAPQPDASQQSEPQQSEPQQAEPQQAEPQQAEPQQAEPQQTEPRQSEQQPNETLSKPQSEPHEDDSPSKQSIQPPFNPSVSTVGFVGAIATVIVAAFLVWSKSSNNSLSPVQLASHAYQRVRPNAPDTSASAQGSADADGWNAGWDDDDDWNPQPPRAKV